MKPWTTFGALVVALAACGPNYRYVYDGEAAFERCYALDYDQGTAPETRAQCWSVWLQSYALGAAPDRVEYARMRATPQPNTPPNTLASAPGTAPAGAMPRQPALAPAWSSAMPASQPAPMAAQSAAPLDPRVAPPTVDPAWQRAQISSGGNPVGAPPPTAGPQAPEAEPPGATCSRECHGTWHECGGRCSSGEAPCVARCDERYRDCMRGCF